MTNKKRNSIIVAIALILIAGITIGYARLSSTLQINGVTKLDDNNWKVIWDSLGNVTKTSGVIVNDAAEIDSTLMNIDFDVELPSPGDYYAFQVDAFNDGTMDAELEDVALSMKLNGSETIDFVNTTKPVYYPVGYTVKLDNDGKEDENGRSIKITSANQELYPKKKADGTNYERTVKIASVNGKPLFVAELKYVDGTDFQVKTASAIGAVTQHGDKLAAGARKRVYVEIKFNDEIVASDLDVNGDGVSDDNDEVNATFHAELVYGQWTE